MIFLVCHVCPKLGVHDQIVPIAAPQCDIPSGKVCQLDTAPIEVATCEHWSIGEVELNTVTISNMSSDNKSVETTGMRGRHREIIVDSRDGESVANPSELPNVDLKPSKGSVEGPQHVGFGSERIQHL